MNIPINKFKEYACWNDSVEWSRDMLNRSDILHLNITQVSKPTVTHKVMDAFQLPFSQGVHFFYLFFSCSFDLFVLTLPLHCIDYLFIPATKTKSVLWGMRVVEKYFCCHCFVGLFGFSCFVCLFKFKDLNLKGSCKFFYQSISLKLLYDHKLSSMARNMSKPHIIEKNMGNWYVISIHFMYHVSWSLVVSATLSNDI